MRYFFICFGAGGFNLTLGLHKVIGVIPCINITCALLCFVLANRILADD